MFKGERAKGELNGFLDAGSHIHGDLHFEDTFRVDGKITGKVISDGDLVVGEPGRVDGEISVARLVVCGTVEGKIIASERAELAVSARVRGEIKTPSLTMEDGAFFEGQCVTGEGSFKQRDRSLKAGR